LVVGTKCGISGGCSAEDRVLKKDLAFHKAKEKRHTILVLCVRHEEKPSKYYVAIKRNEILPFATTWMELEGIMLSEISQTEKDMYHMTSLI